MKRTIFGFLLVFALIASSAGAVVTNVVTLATTATLIYTAPASATGRVLVLNPSASVTVYVGPVGVTTATGFPVLPGAAVGVNLFDGDKLYGIVASSTQVVNTIQGNPQ